MAPEGYYYGLPMLAAGGLIAWIIGPPWATPAFLLAAFLWLVLPDRHKVWQGENVPLDFRMLPSFSKGKSTK